MRWPAVLLAVASAVLLGGAAPAFAGTFEQRTYTGAAGSRPYWLYVPSALPDRAVPLVVMLHGCSQDGPDFAAGTRMNALADRDGFVVAYPEQLAEHNTLRCWNWFERGHQERDAGEPAIIAGIVREVAAERRIDRRRVHVAGLSAGGAMATIMGATHPDVVASVGVGAGLEYRAAEDLPSALAAQQAGGPDPEAQGRLAHAAGGAAARAMPVIVFHGDQDATVRPVNGEQVAAQWAQVADLADGRDDGSVDAVADRTETVARPGRHTATRRWFGPVESWTVHGMTHAWSGGSEEGSYTDPAGPDASAEMLRFFAAHPLPGGVAAPAPAPAPAGAPVADPLRLVRWCLRRGRLRVGLRGDRSGVRRVRFRIGGRSFRRRVVGPRVVRRSRARWLRAVVRVEGSDRPVRLRRSLPRC